MQSGSQECLSREYAVTCASGTKMRPVVQSLNQDIFISCMTRWLLQTQHADPECFCIVLETQNGRHSGGYLTNFKETASQYTTLSIIVDVRGAKIIFKRQSTGEIS